MKFKSLLPAALLTLFGMASCTNDDFNGAPNPKGIPVEITVEAAINSGNDSRAEFNETATGAIKSKWDEGDCIYAYNSTDNTYAGFLVASKPNAEGFSTFTGTLYLYENCKLNFYYLGTDPVRDFNEYWIDLAYQTNDIKQLGELAIMSDNDVEFTFNPNGVSSLNRNLLFNLKLSYAHFNISLPEGVEYKGEDIILKGKNLKNGAALLLLEDRLDIEEWEEGETITINGIGDLYFAFIPGNGVELNFSTEIDGIRYYYDYPRAMNFETGVYYRRAAGNGSFIGVPIDLAPDYEFILRFENGSDPFGLVDGSAAENLPAAVHGLSHTTSYTFTIPEGKPTLPGRGFLGYREVGAGDDAPLYQPGDQLTVDFNDSESESFSKESTTCTKVLECVWRGRVYDHKFNPLAKWAERNLDLSNADGFATDCTQKGQFFQFGRNVAFNSVADARTHFSLYTSAADGSYNSDLIIYSGNQNGSLASSSCYHPGNGAPAERFIINNSLLNGGNDNDWWSERAAMNDTWAKRAAAEGWAEASPCPEGWRLPTAAELAEIMPRTTEIAVTGVPGKDRGQYLTQFNNLLFAEQEVRDNPDVRYAICWHFVYHPTIEPKSIVLRIAALVLDPDYDGPTPEASAIWKDPNAVVRYFPIGGIIKAYMRGSDIYKNKDGRLTFKDPSKPATDYTFYETRYVAQPLHYGVVNTFVKNPYDYNNWCLYNTDGADYTDQHGGYWTSDGAAMEITYDWHIGDAKLVMAGESFALRTVANQNRQMGLHIRPVRK